jgi:8-oxo-dGTP pyrophosphatase MutT (NUDIX family)
VTGAVVRDAATVMLVRDGDDGRMEVFMLRRNLNSDFIGGAYVFPGGAVDEADRHADLEAVCEARSDDQASVMLGVDRGGLAYWVAAVRECFEEAGVLLAYGTDGEVVSFADPDIARRFDEHRGAVDRGARRLVEVCELEKLRLAVDRIHYFSHWITPVGVVRRYDTRFFVTAAPPEQVPLHDDRETIANLWVNPADALARHRAGELDLIFPTIKNLEAIARFDKSAELLAAAAAVEDVPTILPRVTSDAHGMRILLPGDPGYDQA